LLEIDGGVSGKNIEPEAIEDFIKGLQRIGTMILFPEFAIEVKKKKR
jgi:hypothetical protein